MCQCTGSGASLCLQFHHIISCLWLHLKHMTKALTIICDITLFFFPMCLLLVYLQQEGNVFGSVCLFVHRSTENNRGLYYEARFDVKELTSGSTQGFLYHDGGSLLTGFNCCGNLG